jgi:hypothetical protein
LLAADQRSRATGRASGKRRCWRGNLIKVSGQKNGHDDEISCPF